MWIRLTLLLAGLWITSTTLISRAEEPAEPGARDGAAPRLVTTAQLRGHEGRVRTLAFHPEGKVLASGGPDRTLRLWDLDKGAALASITIPRSG